MWRKCDFHRHTVPDGGLEGFVFDPAAFLQGCVDEGLEVVARGQWGRQRPPWG